MDFEIGERVKVVQKGTMRVGGATFTDCTFNNVQVARRNPDGSYGVKGIIATPQTDIVDIPAEWIQPAL